MNSKIVRMFLVLSILIAAILIAMIGTVPAKAAPRPAAPMMTNFAIYSITASCNGSGKVYFLGQILVLR